MLCPFGIDVAFFINQMIGLDPVKRGFHCFADVFCGGKFQIVRIFLHVTVNDLVVEAAEVFNVEVIILIHQIAVVQKSGFSGMGTEL